MVKGYTHHKNGMTRSEYRKAHPEFYEKARQEGGRYAHLQNGMSRSEYYKAHPELYQAALAAADQYRNSKEGKAQLAEKAKGLNASGVLGRKTPISDQEKVAQAARMRQNNPMKQPEVREKVRQQAAERKAELSERTHRLRAEGKMGNPPPMTAQQRQAARQRMTEKNPMSNPETRAKVSRAIQAQYEVDRRAMVQRWVNAGAAPNKAEALLGKMLTPLGFRFTGGGQFWIGPCQSGRCRNPDFIHGSGHSKIAILLNGKYWHSLPKSDDDAAMMDYADKNWRVFVVQDTELSNPALLDTIESWLSGLV